MFFQPLLATNQPAFVDSISSIKRLYYPSDVYNNTVEHGNDAIDKLDSIARDKFRAPNFDALDLARRVDVLNEWKDKHVSRISSQPHYACGSSTPSFSLPLTENFHNHFLKRMYTHPITNIKGNVDWKDSIFRLKPPEDTARLTYNCSANLADFNHFGNVFAVVTRLIQYFSDPAIVTSSLAPAYDILEWEIVADNIRYHFDIETRKISYHDDRGRIFRLLVSTFYHDVGKTIVSHRDALEGAILIAFHARDFLRVFCSILTQSAGEYYDFPEGVLLDKDDVILIEDLVHYHNLYGMMATGETGYVALSEVVDSFRRYSQKYASEDGEQPARDLAISRQILWSIRCLFDLWVLNIADIMTCTPSVAGYTKGDDQVREVWSHNPEGWHPTVEKFLSGPHGRQLCHDLMLSFDLLKRHAQRLHVDDIADMAKAAKDYANRHAIERIVRLVSSTLNDSLGDESRDDDLATRIRRELRSHWRIHSIVNRLVRSFGDVQKFSQNLAWIGHLDYALPFFAVLAKVALNEAREASTKSSYQNPPGSPAGQDRSSKYQERSERDTDADARAIALIENYISVVVQILRRLLEREPSLQAIRNIEFSTARDRLDPSPEKVKRVLGLEGPYRQQRAIHLVLGSIFVW